MCLHTFFTILPKYMTRLILILLTILFAACKSNPENIDNENKENIVLESGKPDSTIVMPTVGAVEESPLEDTIDYNYATYFIIIADTSLDYSALHKKMFDLNRDFHIPIDTMGRFYNESKNLIVLPEDDEDELYAGEYFPRRFPSENLSLEYLDVYQEQTGEKTIALVTGIYENEKTADSTLNIVRKAENKAFKIKSNIYVGCMH